MTAAEIDPRKLDCIYAANDETSAFASAASAAVSAAPDRGDTGWRVNWDRPSRSLVEAASTRDNILQLADRCVDIRDDLDAIVDVFGSGPQLMAKPAFVELWRDFAAAFHLLTEACDTADHPSPSHPPLDWRPLIADARLLAALEAGIAASNELVVARTVKQFLAEHPDFLETS